MENDIWEKKENLKNAKKLVNKFKGKLEAEVKRQKRIEEGWEVKLNPKADEFKRSKLLEKYIAKLLFGWDNKKFKDEYWKKLERNWQK